MAYMSETAKVRPYLTRYCIGYGVDIACGLEKIVPEAMGIDFLKQYNIDDHPVTVANFSKGWEKFFDICCEENSLDYLYSSHLIEDYSNPYEVLQKWLPYLKSGGFLILVLPIEEEFKEHCEKTGQIYNNHHQQNWKGVADFINSMPEELLTSFDIVETSQGIEPVVDYDFFVVFKKK